MLKRKSFIIGAVLALVMVLGVAGCTSDELKALKGTLQKIDSVSGKHSTSQMLKSIPFVRLWAMRLWKSATR
jgi:hypothetical protein